MHITTGRGPFPRLLLFVTTLLAAAALACGDNAPADGPEATSNAVGDSQATASLDRERLEPLLNQALVRAEDVPGTWQARDLGMLEGEALATRGGQQAQIAHAIIEKCLAPNLEGGGSAPDAGVVRVLTSEGTIGAVISTVARAGESAARTVEALRQRVTDEMKACVEREIDQVLGGMVQSTAVRIGEFRNVEDLPAGSGGNIMAMTLGTGGSAFTQRMITAVVARDGLLATALEVTFGPGDKTPEPPLDPKRLAEVTEQRLEEALASR